MRRDIVVAALPFLGIGGLVTVLATACVAVPDGIRAQFAPPAPEERSNFRPGRHGTAPPNEEDAPTPRESTPRADAGVPPTLDAGTLPTAAEDGGIS